MVINSDDLKSDDIKSQLLHHVKPGDASLKKANEEEKKTGNSATIELQFISFGHELRAADRLGSKHQMRIFLEL